MAAVLAFLGFVLLILLHEAGHMVAAKAVGMRVERFSLFMGKPLVSFTRGETEYAIGPYPLGGYVKITGMNPHEEIPAGVAHRAYFRQPPWKRIVVILAGPAVNVVLAFLIWGLLFWANGIEQFAVKVGSVNAQAPAAGELRAGDRILSADGVRLFEPGLSGTEAQQRAVRLQEIVDSHGCTGAETPGCRGATPVELRVQQPGGEVRDLAIVPAYNPEVERMLLGFNFGSDGRSLGPLEASELALDRMWFVTEATVETIVKIFYDAEARDQINSVVGGYEVTRQSFLVDTEQAILVLGLISLSLAIINMFPFLPLDGGHVFWAAAEKVRGRRIPVSVMERASILGILLIGFIFVVGLSNDLDRIISGEGFGVR